MVNNRMEEMAQSSRRKRDREMERSPRSSSPPFSALSLEVVGRHALLFDDDSTADFINSQDALLPWNGDPNLVIDRYDVRHLLEDLTVLRRKKRAPPPPDSDYSDVTQEELDLERYRDLPSTHDDQGDWCKFACLEVIEHAWLPHMITLVHLDLGNIKKRMEGTVKRQKSTCGEYQNVPFSYGTEESSRNGRKSEDAMESSEFNPPFPVPDNLLSHLPPTEKTHQIIARTAKFVSEHGGQSEIVLRVKQGSNPVFGFLMPDHHLHIYFRFLVDHPEVLDADNKADKKHVEKGTVRGEGLSLLGSVYGTGDDEDEGTAQVSVDSKEGGSSIQDCSVDNTSCSADSSMALERAESPIIKDFQDDICSTKPHTAIKHDASIVDQPSVLEGSSHPSGDNLATHASPSHELARNDTQSIQTSGNQAHRESAPILEPPSFLKRVVEKMVEFIARNGKEFEGIIVNQDRVKGRFPFLLPTNPYHPYYLKVLEAAQQGKLHEKGSGSDQTSPTDVRLSEIRKTSQLKKMNSSAVDESLLAPRGSSSEDINPIHSRKTPDLDKKTKFKIVLGGSKKDGCDHGSGKGLGMTSEAAASAVRAATKMPANFRGLSQGTAEVKDGNKKEGGMSADAAAAIVMAATRGSRRPQQGATSDSGTLRGGILQKILKGMSEESDGIGSASPSQDGDASHFNSSSGGMPFVQAGQNSGVSGSSSKFVIDGCLPRQQSGDISGASGSILGLVDLKTPKDDASVAKVMVKAAALAAAREADSSEACLSREEKLKAERLKRAKVFAALIKNEQHVLQGENVQSTPEGAVSVQNESGSKATICGSSYNAASVPLGSLKGRTSDVSARGEDCGQTEVHAASEDCNNKPSTKYLERDRHSHRHRHHSDHHKRSKSQHDKSDDVCDDDTSRGRRHKHDTDKNHKHSSSDRHSRKRHYESSSLRSSEDGHKRHRHRSISRERDDGKRRDHLDSKEDGHRHRSNDNRSQKQHAKKSSSEKEQSFKENIKEKPAANSLRDVEVSAPEVPQSFSPSRASEAPDDLRAKVRAMLLANL